MTKVSAKDRLIEAAFDLFDERGYEQTTVDDIAERAAVSRATFFRIFRSKEDVIFPDHDLLMAGVRDRLLAAAPGAPDVALEEATRLVLVHYLTEGDVARRRYALTRSVPTLRDREIASIRQYEQLFREFAHSAMGGGPDAALPAELLANAVVTAHNHVLRRWLRGETDDAEAEFHEAMQQVLSQSGQRLYGDGAGDRESAVLVVRTRKDLESALPQIRRLLT
jgi:AcrR family transcriptional regulator